MSFPCTTKLSLDFFKSSVSISTTVQITVSAEPNERRTMTVQSKVQNIADFDVDNAEEALIPPLELALIEYLDCDDGGVLDGTVRR